MRLRTLGGLALEGVAFSRPKPLLLLTYLALEGRQDRRHLAELFWPRARDRMKVLAVTLTRLRQGAPGSVEADGERAWTAVGSDADAFTALVEGGRHAEASEAYQGPFLDGFHLRHWSVELEEWVYQTRELLAGLARRALVETAEAYAADGRFEAASERAAAAYRLRHAPAPEPDELQRLHTLLCAGRSPHANAVREEALGFELDLAASAEQARTRLRPSLPSSPVPTNLPALPRTFVGRDLERIEVAAAITRPDCRLLTLVGPAGVGKTRLALQVAREQRALGSFPGGVYHVPVGALSSPSAIVAAVATALDPDAATAVPRREGMFRSPDGDALLVLDDVEHLVARSATTPGAPADRAPDGGALADTTTPEPSTPDASTPDGSSVLADLVTSCPVLTLLVTSRQRLNLEHEHVFPLEGLSYPEHDRPALTEARRFEAIALFEQRARRARPGFELTDQDLDALLRLCRAVEGLPLALELAAGWVRAMPLAEIAAELDAGLDLLTSLDRDAPARRQSMRAALEVSWQLLSDPERALLRALSVFADGFRREAANAVAGARIPLLAALVDTSWLRLDDSGRYGRHPLVRQFSAERLQRRVDEHARMRRNHRRHYLGLLRRHEEALAGSSQQHDAITVIEETLPNVEQAWRTAAEDAALDDLWLACRPMQLFYIQHGGCDRVAVEAFGRAAAAVAGSDGRQQQLLGRLLVAEAWFRFRISDGPGSARAAERGLDLLRSHGGAAAADGPAVERAIISALNTLGNLAKRRGDLRAAEGHFSAALAHARDHGIEAQVAILTNNLALLHKANGAYDEAERLFGEALQRNRARGNTRSVARNLANLGACLVLAGAPDRAVRLLEEGVRLATEIGYEDLLRSLVMNLGAAEFARGRYRQAHARYLEALTLAAETTDREFEADAHCWLGRIEAALGRRDEARSHFLRALGIAGAIDYHLVVCEGLIGLAELHQTDGALEEAATLLGSARRRGPLPADSVHRSDALMAALRATLPEGVLEAAFERGRRLPPEPTLATLGLYLDAAT